MPVHRSGEIFTHSVISIARGNYVLRKKHRCHHKNQPVFADLASTIERIPNHLRPHAAVVLRKISDGETEDAKAYVEAVLKAES